MDVRLFELVALTRVIHLVDILGAVTNCAFFMSHNQVSCSLTRLWPFLEKGAFSCQFRTFLALSGLKQACIWG